MTIKCNMTNRHDLGGMLCRWISDSRQIMVAGISSCVWYARINSKKEQRCILDFEKKRQQNITIRIHKQVWSRFVPQCRQRCRILPHCRRTRSGGWQSNGEISCSCSSVADEHLYGKDLVPLNRRQYYTQKISNVRRLS